MSDITQPIALSKPYMKRPAISDPSRAFASRQAAAREIAKRMLGHGTTGIEVIEITPFMQRKIFLPLSIFGLLWMNTFGRECSDYSD